MDNMIEIVINGRNDIKVWAGSYQINQTTILNDLDLHFLNLGHLY